MVDLERDQRGFTNDTMIVASSENGAVRRTTDLLRTTNQPCGHFWLLMVANRQNVIPSILLQVLGVTQEHVQKIYSDLEQPFYSP